MEDEVSKWEPIETAPKDRHILLFVVMPPCFYATALGEPKGWKGVSIGSWNDVINGWDSNLAGNPTHWMPLPAFPETN